MIRILWPLAFLIGGLCVLVCAITGLSLPSTVHGCGKFLEHRAARACRLSNRRADSMLRASWRSSGSP